jgi:hypothetical protein
MIKKLKACGILYQAAEDLIKSPGIEVSSISITKRPHICEQHLPTGFLEKSYTVGEEIVIIINTRAGR